VALGLTNINTTNVGAAIGSSSDIVRVLCTFVDVNPCSQYRPGLWDIGSGSDFFIYYQVPRGSGYTDPRGTYNGSDKESYHLGDFRGYNHAAGIPYVAYTETVIQFGFGTTTTTGITLTFYVYEMNWKQTASGLERREENDWPTMTHVHLLDASDDSIVGSAAIPTSGGNVSIAANYAITTPGVQVDKTFHVAMGIDVTHWSFKVGTDQGLGGIGLSSAIQLKQALIIEEAAFDDDSFIETGVPGTVYTSAEVITPGDNDNVFSGDQAIWNYNQNDDFRCYHSGGSNDFRSINAKWFIKGFIEDPDVEYEVKTANFLSNNANNVVDLSSMVDSPPRGFWKDGDEIALILRELTVNF
jgi:hypothetical protein